MKVKDRLDETLLNPFEHLKGRKKILLVHQAPKDFKYKTKEN